GVKPVDDNNASAYQNSHHAGTPENFRNFVTGGARGGGGSNFTGSYSATASVTPSLFVPPPPAATASLSGAVVDSNGAALAATLTLTYVDSTGATVSLTVTSNEEDGTYSFTSLAAGTYTLSVSLDTAAAQVGTVAGSFDGSASGNTVSLINLGSGDNG